MSVEENGEWLGGEGIFEGRRKSLWFCGSHMRKPVKSSSGRWALSLYTFLNVYRSMCYKGALLARFFHAKRDVGGGTSWVER